MMCTVTKEKFTAYKSADGSVVTLEIPVGSLTNINRKDVVDPNRAEFRCSKALVLEIRDKDTNETANSISSDVDKTFQYIVDETVEPREKYDLDPDKVCASGIHFFLTQVAAYDYDRIIENGLYQDWYPNGRPFVMAMVENGRKHGERKIYYAHGQLYILENWVNGYKSGSCRTWDKDGWLRCIEIYKEDRLNTEIVYYNDRHTMIFYVYEIVGWAPREQVFYHENELTILDKMNHENQLLNTGTLVLSSDYILQ